MPPFLYPLAGLLGLGLFTLLYGYFRRSSSGRQAVRELIGSDTPDEVVRDLTDAQRRAREALPEAEQELALMVEKVRRLRRAAGIPEKE